MPLHICLEFSKHCKKQKFALYPFGNYNQILPQKQQYKNGQINYLRPLQGTYVTNEQPIRKQHFCQKITRKLLTFYGNIFIKMKDNWIKKVCEERFFRFMPYFSKKPNASFAHTRADQAQSLTAVDRERRIWFFSEFEGKI